MNVREKLRISLFFSQVTIEDPTRTASVTLASDLSPLISKKQNLLILYATYCLVCASLVKVVLGIFGAFFWGDSDWISDSLVLDSRSQTLKFHFRVWKIWAGIWGSDPIFGRKSISKLGSKVDTFVDLKVSI